MDPVTGVVAAKAIQEVSSLVTDVIKSDETNQAAEGGSFDSILKGLLNPDGANNVNEEELFAALIQERILSAHGEEAANKYAELLEQKKGEVQQDDGYISVELAAKEALNAMVENGDLEAGEAEIIRAQSFDAAQLDDNVGALYDSRGSEDDPTIAVMGAEDAIIRARLMIESFDSGEQDPSDAGAEEGNTGQSDAGSGDADASGGVVTPQGNDIDGASEGFLWKPAADGDGNLVVLMPQLDITSVLLKDEEGNVVEEGRSSGFANADSKGEREHFRFSKPGSEYGANLTVEVTLSDGTVREYQIPNPGERYD